MIAKLASEAQHVVMSMQGNLIFSLKIVGVLWAAHLINYAGEYSFNRFGIVTRNVTGLPGILISPFLHADFNHLFFNTIPLFVLSDLVLLGGKVQFYYITGSIIILSGFLTWLMGKRGVHIGASGVIMGYFGYLLAKAYFNLTGTTIILAIICIYYFGGLIFSVFPGAKKNVSWEGHVFGLASGIFVAYYLPSIIKIARGLHL